MSASAGRVLLLFKGDYSAGTTYVPMDCVYYNGASYVCKAETTDNLPTNTTYWQVLAQKGADGGVPSGGTTGQVVTKASNTDYDVEWADTFSIEDARDAEVIPSKNLLPITLSSLKAIYNNTSGTWTGNTYALGNATFQVVTNTNGYVEKIVINSTSNTSDVSLWLNFRGYTSANNMTGCIISDIYEGNTPKNVFQAYRIGNKSTGAYVDRLVDTTGEITIPILTSEQDGSICVSVKAGATVSNVEYYPMICTQEEWNKSHTYEPYYIPLKDAMFRREEQGVLGAKNQLKNTKASATNNGITFTVNADGSVTANGTLAQDKDNAQFMISHRLSPGPCILKAGNYIATGCPANGSATTYEVRITQTINGSGTYVSDFGDGVEFTVDEEKFVGYICYITTHETLSDLTFYPMIRLASDPDDTYQPYAMTNQELTSRHISKLLATATAGTYASQLATLNTEYNKHTVDEKMRMWIALENNGSLAGVFKLSEPTIASFMQLAIVLSSGNILTRIFRLSNQKAIEIQVASNGTVTYNDVSSTSNSYVFKLYLD